MIDMPTREIKYDKQQNRGNESRYSQGNKDNTSNYIPSGKRTVKYTSEEKTDNKLKRCTYKNKKKCIGECLLKFVFLPDSKDGLKCWKDGFAVRNR